MEEKRIELFRQFAITSRYISDFDLRGADFRGAQLEQVALRRANMLGAHLEGACFERAELQGAVFDNAHFDFTNFNGADLGGSSLKGVDFRNSMLDGDTTVPYINKAKYENIILYLHRNGNHMFGLVAVLGFLSAIAADIIKMTKNVAILIFVFDIFFYLAIPSMYLIFIVMKSVSMIEAFISQGVMGKSHNVEGIKISISQLDRFYYKPAVRKWSLIKINANVSGVNKKAEVYAPIDDSWRILESNEIKTETKKINSVLPAVENID